MIRQPGHLDGQSLATHGRRPSTPRASRQAQAGRRRLLGLSEADALIRLRLKEQGLRLPHLVVGAMPDNQIVERSNGDPGDALVR
jgi:hypothetical protein